MRRRLCALNHHLQGKSNFWRTANRLLCHPMRMSYVKTQMCVKRRRMGSFGLYLLLRLLRFHLGPIWSHLYFCWSVSPKLWRYSFTLKLVMYQPFFFFFNWYGDNLAHSLTSTCTISGVNLWLVCPHSTLGCWKSSWPFASECSHEKQSFIRILSF